MTDATDIYSRRPQPSPNGGGRDWRSMPGILVAAAGALVLAIIVILVALALTGGDDSSVDTTGSSTTTSSSTATTTTTEPDTSASTSPSTSTTESTTTASTTSTEPATSTSQAPDIYRTAVWPWPDSSTRYDDPVDAARGFAEDYVGFTDPVVGEFMQGDSRSGEVEIRPVADGPTTVVFVRQLGPDDSWWVLGTGTTNITIDQPAALSTIDSPLTVTGTALAFEGQVDVALRADGSLPPLFEGFVTGGGDEPRPFEGTFEWTNPGEEAGVLLLLTSGGEDGRVWEAGVIRVLFADSD